MDDGRARRERIEKYDRGAETYSSGFVDPASIARRQVELLTRWGAAVPSGASVLELGCADGMITETLVAAGFAVTAVDFSPGMIAEARRRLERAGLEAVLRVADVNELEPTEDYDVVLGLMRTFFSYATDPADVLTRLARRARRKVLVDFNPRTHPVAEATRAMRAAGLGSVAWRPFFVPAHRRVAPPTRLALRVAEHVPPARGLILRRAFNAVVKGER
jgi:2-polyprenyl-3-methyl-5-hydroxy-6-metoxy-1,4-benzoquinol methylase